MREVNGCRSYRSLDDGTTAVKAESIATLRFTKAACEIGAADATSLSKPCGVKVSKVKVTTTLRIRAALGSGADDAFQVQARLTHNHPCANGEFAKGNAMITAIKGDVAIGPAVGLEARWACGAAGNTASLHVEGSMLDLSVSHTLTLKSCYIHVDAFSGGGEDGWSFRGEIAGYLPPGGDAADLPTLGLSHSALHLGKPGTSPLMMPRVTFVLDSAAGTLYVSKKREFSFGCISGVLREVTTCVPDDPACCGNLHRMSGTVELTCGEVKGYAVITVGFKRVFVYCVKLN